MALYNDPDETWANATGRVVLAFGDIENTARRCLARLAREPTHFDPAKIPLRPKLARIRDALASEQCSEADELRSVVACVDELVDSRNLVAHNGVSALGMAHVEETSEGVTLKFEPTLTSSRDSTAKLTLPELRELAELTEALAWQFTTAAHAAFCVLPWVDYEP